VTRQLADAGRVVGVELLDHVVIGRPEADPGGKGWFSFGEAGLI
jgi:DNA repair protein RadC